MNEPGLGSRSYYLVGAALMVLLAATLGATYLNTGPFHTVIALGIAGLKAGLVLLFFMHVRYGSRMTWVFAGVGFYWLAILIVLLMGDATTRDWSAWFPFPR